MLQRYEVVVRLRKTLFDNGFVIDREVVAEDGETTKTYTIVVTKTETAAEEPAKETESSEAPQEDENV